MISLRYDETHMVMMSGIKLSKRFLALTAPLQNGRQPEFQVRKRTFPLLFSLNESTNHHKWNDIQINYLKTFSNSYCFSQKRMPI